MNCLRRLAEQSTTPQKWGRAIRVKGLFRGKSTEWRMQSFTWQTASIQCILSAPVDGNSM